MGSWNGTCGVTQLPIKSGEKIVVFLMIKNEHCDLEDCRNFYHAHDIYTPITLPIYGEYDDYGGIENISKNGDIALSFIHDLLKESKIQINESELKREVGFKNIEDAVPKTPEELINTFVERGVYANIGMFMIHQEVFDSIVKEMGSRTPYNKTQTMRESLMESGAHLHDEPKKDLARLQKGIEETLAESSEEEKEELKEMFEALLDSAFDRMRDNKLARYVSRYEGEYRLLSYYLKQYMETNQEDYLEGFIDLYVFDVAMNYMRKTWMAQPGAGSQNEEIFLHKIVAESVLKHYQNKQKDYAEDDTDAGEEDLSGFGKETFFG